MWTVSSVTDNASLQGTLESPGAPGILIACVKQQIPETLLFVQ